MDPISTTAIAIAANKAYKVFQDVIYHKIYGVSKEELEASNKEKAKDIVATKEVNRDLIIKSEIIKIQREYKNLGKTLNLATPYVTSEKNQITEENDFFWNILEHSKEISNSEMQALIAKIIAGEYNNPQTYSMSTLQVLKSLDAKLLSDFNKILGVSFAIMGVPKDIFSNAEHMKLLGVFYPSLLELQNIGLITSNEASLTNDEKITDVYINKQVNLTPKNEAVKSVTSPDFYMLTKAGREIAKHLNVLENPNFISWFQKEYEKRDFKIEIE